MHARALAIIPPEHISNHMILAWDRGGSVIGLGDVIPATLALSAIYSQAFILYLIDIDERSFSLDIVIRTTEYTT